MIKIPVLILAFNRPEYTIQLVEEIYKDKNFDIHISIDGPRNKQDQRNQLDIVQNLPENLKINLLEKNMGCREGVYAGIDWFFSRNSSGIVLEDDIRLNEMGKKFLISNLTNLNTTIFLASACNILDAWGLYSSKNNVLMNFPQIWSWCSTANNWQAFRSWKLPDKTIFERKISTYSFLQRSMLLRIYELEKSYSVDTWDYRLALYFVCERKSAIISKKNYCENLDISGGTHGTGKFYPSMIVSTEAPVNECESDPKYLNAYFRKIQNANLSTYLSKLILK